MSADSQQSHRDSSREMEVRLVRKITEKTRQKKIRWAKVEDGLTAISPGAKLQLSFVKPHWLAAKASHDWSLFTVREAKGRELLTVEHSGMGSPARYSGDPLLTAVDELFEAVLELGEDDIRRAIEIIDGV